MCLMCGCGSAENFMGVALPNQNVYDVGPGQLSSPAMFGTDSMNPLGSSEEYRGSNMEMEDEMETETEDMD
jgi:hypothetical protein